MTDHEQMQTFGDYPIPEEHQNLPLYDRRAGGLCPVDPLYCSRYFDHACFNADSFASGYVIYGKPAPETA